MADMQELDSLSESQENYIEAIFHIIARKKAAKPRDISKALGVNNSSVTGALRVLAKKGLINYAPFDVVTLTPEGEAAAQNVIHRHEALRGFLTQVLGIGRSEADEAACRMEHAVSAEIIERFAQFARFTEDCPRAGAEWLGKFRACFLAHGKAASCDCEPCLAAMSGDEKRRDAPGKSAQRDD